MSEHVNDNGSVKMNRSRVVGEIIARNKNAWCLLTLIAKHTWLGPLQDRHDCEAGEAYVGDYADYGFTRMEFRVALDYLVKFGLIEIVATSPGTIVRLLSSTVFDIYVDEIGADRPSEQPTNNHIVAEEQPTDSHGATTTSDSKREKRRDSGTVAAPTPDLLCLEPEAEPEPEPAAPALPDTSGDEEDQTPQEKAMELSKTLPKILRTVCRLNRIPVFTPDTLQAAIEYFERNINYQWYDVALICLLGIRATRETPVPEGLDPYYQCRRFAHLPNKMFDSSLDNDLHLALMQNELGYNAGLPENHYDFLLVLNEEYKRVGAPLDPRTKLRTNLE